jgi:hypothetical protein
MINTDDTRVNILLDALRVARIRITELESAMAAHTCVAAPVVTPASVAPVAAISAPVAAISAASKPRATRTPKAATEPCQYCGDIKVDKVTAPHGLPICQEWRTCASRIRRNAKAGNVNAYAYDRRYITRPDHTPDGKRWACRFDGEVIAIAATQSEARALGNAHRVAAMATGELVSA